jgi:hypothetical protein
MKNLLFTLFISPFFLIAQTKTSVANGDFYNPLTWDCLCFPANGDNVTINHDLTINAGIYYSAGKITINASGSLSDNGTDKDIWVDGSGQFINHGDLSIRHFATSQFAYLDNTGNFIGLDSMLTQGVTNNSGSIEVYDFANDQTGNFGNFGEINVTNNMNNQGNLDNWANIQIGLDFSNCNTQTLNAELTNNGTICIARNFLNCGGDELNGNGHFFIGSLASNLGLFSGSFTFHTPSGTMALPGTINGGVTITTGGCSMGINENESITFELYPNPANQILNVSENSGEYVITNMAGQIIQQGELNQAGINVSSLTSGMYLFQLNNLGVARFQKY